VVVEDDIATRTGDATAAFFRSNERIIFQQNYCKMGVLVYAGGLSRLRLAGGTLFTHSSLAACHFRFRTTTDSAALQLASMTFQPGA
jgi:hypothetical protein